MRTFQYSTQSNTNLKCYNASLLVVVSAVLLLSTQTLFGGWFSSSPTITGILNTDTTSSSQVEYGKKRLKEKEEEVKKVIEEYAVSIEEGNAIISQNIKILIEILALKKDGLIKLEKYQFNERLNKK